MTTQRLEVRGVPELTKGLAKVQRQYQESFAAGLYRLGVEIISNALPRTPVEFSVLRTSAYVSPPKKTKGGSGATVEVGYGTRYAVYQHEGLHFRHPRGGEPKFLEKAINAVAVGAVARMAAWLKAHPDAKYGQMAGVNTRPTITNTTPGKKTSQRKRLAKAGRNVRKRTGR